VHCPAALASRHFTRSSSKVPARYTCWDVRVCRDEAMVGREREREREGGREEGGGWKGEATYKVSVMTRILSLSLTLSRVSVVVLSLSSRPQVPRPHRARSCLIAEG
jgi:hypothetical protein